MTIVITISFHYLEIINIPLYNLDTDTKILISTQSGFFDYFKYRAFYRPHSLWPFGLLLLAPLIAYLTKRKIKKNNEMEAIFRELRMVHDEEIHDRKKPHGIPKVVAHIPKIDTSALEEKSYLLLKNVHPKCEKSVFDYSNGLLEILKEKGMIPTADGICDATGRPGEFKLTLMTEMYRKQKRLEDVLEKARLYFEETVGKSKIKKFPKVQLLENDNLLIDTIGVNLGASDIKEAIETLSNEFKNFYPDRKIEFIYVTEPKTSVFEVHASKPAQMVLPKGQSIMDNMEVWEKEGPIDRMRKLFKKENQFYWFFGQLREQTFKINDNMIIVSGDTLVHPYLIGTTGSGKTEALKTLLMTAKHAYGDDIEIYCANGTPSADLDPIAQYYSPMGREAAKPEGATEQEKLIRLLNILNYCFDEATRRGNLFKDTFNETGKECLKISAYRGITDKKLPEIIVAIDEFAGYSILNYDHNYNKIGTPAYILQVGFSQWRKYGIHFVIATQEVKAASIPRRLFTNMLGGVVFQIQGSDKTYMETSLQYDFEGQMPKNFGKGEGLFSGGNLRCALTGATRIPVASPYIGTNIMDYIKHVGLTKKPEDKTEYDTDLLNLSDKDLDFSIISAKNLQTSIEKCFLERENWSVYKKENPRNRIFNVYAEYVGSEPIGSVFKGTKLGIAFVTYTDVMSPNWKERVNRENPDSVNITVYLVTADVKHNKMDEMREALLDSGSAMVLFKSDYVMSLREAYEFYIKKLSDPVFNLLLGSLDIQNKIKIEKDIGELYKGLPASRKLHLDELTRIKEIEDSQKKGAEFESFYIALERDLGYDTIHGKELALSGFVNMKFANSNADGGLDIFRFTNRDEKRGIGIQLKNMTSRQVDVKIIDKLVKTKLLFESEGIIFDSFGLITTGDITSQAKMEAEKLGFFMINGERLDNIILRQDKAIYNEKQKELAYTDKKSISENTINKIPPINSGLDPSRLQKIMEAKAQNAKQRTSFLMDGHIENQEITDEDTIINEVVPVMDSPLDEPEIDEENIRDSLVDLVDFGIINVVVKAIRDPKVKSQRFKELIMEQLEDCEIDNDTGLIKYKNIKIACKIANSKPFRDSDYVKLNDKVEEDVYVILIGVNSTNIYTNKVIVDPWSDEVLLED